MRQSLLYLVLSLTLFITSCSKKYTFGPSATIPSARGSVNLDKDKNNNYVVDVRVEHLAEPERLQPPKSTYIVWIETLNNGTQNLGQLRTARSSLKGTLKAVSVYQPIRVFITAEDQPNVSYPGGTEVLTTGLN